MKSEEVKIFCENCGVVLHPDDPIQVMRTGFSHDACIIEEEEKWWVRFSMQELIDVLNRVDQYRYTEFYVSYISSNHPLFVSKEAYIGVFSVHTTRQEVVDAIESKKNS